MTCIVGLAEKNVVYMGCDSAGVAGYDITVRSDEKVFQNGPFLIGFCGSFRMGQLLRYKLEVPVQADGQDTMHYMVTDFVDAVKDCFAKNGFGSMNEKTDNRGGLFLAGYRGVLYRIDYDFQVGISSNQYESVGCGKDLALGAMYALSNKKPVERVGLALEAAAKFSGGVVGPFLILKQVKRK
jgi:ATP-dependent protease HslVU (ClpYQ) peptidase subunit